MNILKYLLIILLFLIPSPVLASTFRVDFLNPNDGYEAGKNYSLSFRIDIEKPWFIHGPGKNEEGLIPTVLTFENSPEIKIDQILFPEPEKVRFSYAKTPVEVLSGAIDIKATLHVARNIDPGIRSVKGTLSYQACKEDSCLPPESVSLKIKIPVVSTLESIGTLTGGTPTETGTAVSLDENKIAMDQKISNGFNQGFNPGAGLFLTLIGIFLGGLALNLTPCVYPLIPITVSFFGGKNKDKKAGAIINGLVYILGLSVTNSILGLVAAMTGGLLGSALQNPVVLAVIALIMVSLGLSFFGFWEIRLPSGLMNIASKNYSGLFGTFFMGLTLGLVAAPCLGPFILGLLTYVGRIGDPLLGFIYFFVLSIGLGLPLAVLGIFSSGINRLPLSGDWMLWVKKLMGWILIAMAAFILSPVFSSYTVKAGLLPFVGIAAGVHLGWIDSTGKSIKRFILIKRLAGILIICLSVIYFYSDRPVMNGIQWRPYSDRIIADAAREGKPVMIDFYADWCQPCRAMDENVFPDPQIVELSKNLIPVRLDLTKRLPYQDMVLNKYNVRGVPTIIFINMDGKEEKGLRIETYTTASVVLKRMEGIIIGN